jgi:Mce-associated membrane protein
MEEDEVRRRPSRAVLITAGLLVIAVAFAGWAGFLWLRASGDDRHAYVADRDAVLQTGYHDIATLTSLDYRQPDASLKRWSDASTGTLHEQLAQTSQPTKEQLTAAKTVTTGTVVDASVTELDARAGTATLIASVQVVVTPVSGKAVTKRNRLRADLTRTADGWKLSSLGQVPMGGA